MTRWKTVGGLVLVGLVGCGASVRHVDGSNADDGPNGAGSGGSADQEVPAAAGENGAGARPETSGAGGGTAGQSEPVLRISAIAQGDGVLVAGGHEDSTSAEHSAFFRSTDGVTWSKVAAGLALVPTDIEFGNGHFVAIGGTYDAVTGSVRDGAAVSDDGEHWEDSPVPLTWIGTQLAFGNGVFITGGDTGVFSSADGKEWNLVGPALGLTYGMNVAFAAGTFVGWAPSSNHALVGTGEDWANVALAADTSTYAAVDIESLGDHFGGIEKSDCCFGEVPTGIRYRTLTSTNGTDWTFGEEVGALPPLPVIDDGRTCIAFHGDEVLAGPSCDALEVTFSEPPFIPAAALESQGRYFVVGGPPGALLTSNDGVTWTQVLFAAM